MGFRKKIQLRTYYSLVSGQRVVEDVEIFLRFRIRFLETCVLYTYLSLVLSRPFVDFQKCIPNSPPSFGGRRRFQCRLRLPAAHYRIEGLEGSWTTLCIPTLLVLIEGTRVEVVFV